MGRKIKEQGQFRILYEWSQTAALKRWDWSRDLDLAVPSTSSVFSLSFSLSVGKFLISTYCSATPSGECSFCPFWTQSVTPSSVIPWCLLLSQFFPHGSLWHDHFKAIVLSFSFVLCMVLGTEWVSDMWRNWGRQVIDLGACLSWLHLGSWINGHGLPGKATQKRNV